MRLNDETPENDPFLGADALKKALATVNERQHVMSQLVGQKVVSAVVKYGDEALSLAPDTKATLVWLRSYRIAPPAAVGQQGITYGGTGPLVHEYQAYAHNELGHFVSFTVTSDRLTDIRFPETE